MFDVCLVAHVSRVRVFPLIARFMQGTQGVHDAVAFERTKRVVVTAEKGILPAHADGETLSTEDVRLEMELLPRQIAIIGEAEEVA